MEALYGRLWLAGARLDNLALLFLRGPAKACSMGFWKEQGALGVVLAGAQSLEGAKELEALAIGKGAPGRRVGRDKIDRARHDRAGLHAPGDRGRRPQVGVGPVHVFAEQRHDAGAKGRYLFLKARPPSLSSFQLRSASLREARETTLVMPRPCLRSFPPRLAGTSPG